jgi:acyl-CoA thioesterase FadM
VTGSRPADGSDERTTATVTYRVRFDECGPDGLARTSMFLRYAQDAAWLHSERLGFDRDWYALRGLTWLVRAAALEILEPVPLGTVLAVSTTVAGFRKVWARRRTEARLPGGRIAALAHTDWVIIDARGQPTRVPPDFPAAFGARPDSFDPGRVALPVTPADAVAHRGRVRPQDVDPLDHANNAAYLDYLEEALLAAGEEAAAAIAALPRRIEVEYLFPATTGVGVTGWTWPLPSAAGPRHGWAWRLGDDEGHELARGRLIEGGSTRT